MRKTAVTICIFFFLFSYPASGDVRGSVTARMESGGLFLGRILFQGPRWKTVCTGLFDSRDRRRFSAGFRVPGLLCGPVELSGLLREAYRPTSYRSGSDVFSQAPGLSLYRGLEIVERKGVSVFLAPERAALFGFLEGASVQGGGAVNLSENNFLHLRGVVAFSSRRQEKRDEDAPWFLSEPELLDGSSLHAGLSADLLGRFFAARYGVFISSSPRASPGVCHRLALGVDTEFMELDLFCASADRDYFGPGGNFPSVATSLSGSFTLFPKKVLSLSGRAGRRMFRSSWFPELTRKQDNDFSLALEFEKEGFSCGAGIEYRYNISRDGELYVLRRLRGEGEVRFGFFRADMLLLLSFDSRQVKGRKVAAGFIFETKYANFRLKPSVSWSEDLSFTAELRLDMKNREGRECAFFRIALQGNTPFHLWSLEFKDSPFGYLFLSAGWKYSVKFPEE